MGGGKSNPISNLNPLDWNSKEWASTLSGGILYTAENPLLRTGMQGVSELTGAAAMTRAMEQEAAMAEARLEEERVNREQMQVEEDMAAEQADRRASSRAQAIRTSSNLNQGNFLGL